MKLHGEKESGDDSGLIVPLARPCVSTETDALFFPASGAMAASRKAAPPKDQDAKTTFPLHDIPLVPFLQSVWVELFKLIFWREFEQSSTFALHMNKVRRFPTALSRPAAHPVLFLCRPLHGTRPSLPYPPPWSAARSIVALTRLARVAAIPIPDRTARASRRSPVPLASSRDQV